MNPNLQMSIDNSILLLQENVFHLKLKTHILYGKLSGFHSCSCGYDCRILFKIFSEKNPTELLLLDIGSHDVVY
jgi:mRNA-degrading endonuclease YafQ of YafQ-DinJ toxin-antitoxin module